MQKIQKWFACLLAFVLLFSVALAEDTVSVDRKYTNGCKNMNAWRRSCRSSTARICGTMT